MLLNEKIKNHSLLDPRELLDLKLKHNKLFNDYKKAMTDLGYATYKKLISNDLKDDTLEKHIIHIRKLEMEMEEICEKIY